jgi:hypothetical protein
MTTTVRDGGETRMTKTASGAGVTMTTTIDRRNRDADRPTRTVFPRNPVSEYLMTKMTTSRRDGLAAESMMMTLKILGLAGDESTTTMMFHASGGGGRCGSTKVATPSGLAQSSAA